MTTLSKEDVVRIAKDAGLSPVGRAGELMRNGDGRWVAVSALETIANLARADLVAENERLNNDLLDALDCKQGKGPTALATVIAERDELRVQLEATWYALAAAEADNERLRGSVSRAKALAKQGGERLMKAHSILKGNWLGCLDDALNDIDGILDASTVAIAKPRDDSALREMIAGVYEECAERLDEFAYLSENLEARIDAIRALAEKAKVE